MTMTMTAAEEKRKGDTRLVGYHSGSVANLCELTGQPTLPFV